MKKTGVCNNNLNHIRIWKNNANDSTLNSIKNKKLYHVGKCCAENGVPDHCLGLCVEDNDASFYQLLPDICEQYNDTIHTCTIINNRKFDMHQN